ncbi:MAG: tryptophan synthase subunit alpha [Oscillospiraceae bacterium]|jgi:tryptophan synthase alpha chain|nr:tryptophan synthase subunit alpha [Oscillospiraceae bacterium]
MSKIANAFDHGKAFIGFVTGGDPTLELSEQYILAMARAGADLIEIGIPFSDPIAEGATIQEANLRALRAGSTVEKIFGLAGRARAQIQTPLVFLTYLNPVYRYGYEAFFARCAAVGVDGIIIPDLPFEEQGELRDICAANGVDLISLIAPTSKQRIAEIARCATGFLYAVSSMGVTGVRSELNSGLPGMIQLAKATAKIPVAVGFGVSSPAQAKAIAQYADGVIVGSAIVKLVEQYGEAAEPHIDRYVREMKQAIG